MSHPLALVIHPEEDLRNRVEQALARNGLKVMTAHDDQEALERLGYLSFLVPNIVVTHLKRTHPQGSEFLALARRNPLTQKLPVVILGPNEGEHRRQALRLGLTHIVPPPFNDEDIYLTCRLALEQYRDDPSLAGTLDQMPLADLLQTAEASRREGTVELRKRDGRTATVWMRGGRVVDARISDGRSGREAFLAIAQWDEGSFEAKFGPVTAPERISESTSYLLLEAMRLKDEAARHSEPPPHAALPDPPPLPERSLLAAHRGLTLVNIASAYAGNHLVPKLLRERLEQYRAEVAADHPLLTHFVVGSGGRVSLNFSRENLRDLDVDAFVEATSTWLGAFFDGIEHALPGRFQRQRLRSLSEAIQDDLSSLGFYRLLDIEPSADD